MTPTTTITLIANRVLHPTQTTAPRVASSAPLASAARVRNPRNAEVLAWLTHRLDWETHLDRLHERHAENRTADVARGRHNFTL
jgi:hypothetical protein